MLLSSDVSYISSAISSGHRVHLFSYPPTKLLQCVLPMGVYHRYPCKGQKLKDRQPFWLSSYGAVAVICVWRIIFESQTLRSAVTDRKLEDKGVKKEGRLPGDGDRQQSTNYLPCQWKITYTCMLRGSQMWSPAETEREQTQL